MDRATVYSGGSTGDAPMQRADLVSCVGTPERPRWPEPVLLEKLVGRLNDGASLFVDFDKYPGPSSYSPIEGFQPETPIPATLYLWRKANPAATPSYEGVVQRSGYPEEPLGNVTDPASFLSSLWRQHAYLDRVGYMDSTGYKVVVARASQIDLLSAPASSASPSPRLAEEKEKKENGKDDSLVAGIGIGLVVLLGLAVFAFLRGKR